LIFRETGDRHGEGQTLTNLGNAYLTLGRVEQAIGCFQDALARSRPASWALEPPLRAAMTSGALMTTAVQIRLFWVSSR
jgi:tetratricopeptide (TPR) repeat protein